ncbi:MAG: phosphatase PAP2 family protein [Verrucomicrobia bacterium]|nr:phosphatase PAP2 family protein [Verrucomicrobiota bacterium]
MNFESLHQMELAWMQKLQALHSPFLDQFMIFMNYLDTNVFYLMLVAAIWYAYDQQCGKRLFFLLILNSFAVHDLKMVFSEPRPCQLEPTLGLLTARSYGFPSGAAQAWISSFLLLACSVRRRWFWIVGSLLVLLVSFSRVYLGLHFPSDIVGGWIFGSAVFFCFWKCLPWVERLLSKQGRAIKSILSLLFFSGLYLLGLNRTVEYLVLVGIGGSLGMIWAPALAEPTNVLQRLYRPAIVVAGIVLMKAIIAQPALSLLNGLWLSAALPLSSLFKRDHQV